MNARDSEKLVGVLEQIGSWETNLSDYATKEEVNAFSISLGNISTKVENLVNNIGFLLLMVLMLYVTLNDILRLF